MTLDDVRDIVKGGESAWQSMTTDWRSPTRVPFRPTHHVAPRRVERDLSDL